jgi:hypothetical protein
LVHRRSDRNERHRQESAAIRRSGVLGLRLRTGKPMNVWFKELSLKKL